MEQGTEPGARGSARGRPLGVWIVTILLLVTGVVMGAEFIGVPADWPTWLIANTPALSGHRWVYLLIALASMSAALWLWLLSRRGWALTMVLVGTGLIINLVLWWTGSPNHLRMALNVAMAFYLNSSAVRAVFERRHDVVRLVLSDRSHEQ